MLFSSQSEDLEESLEELHRSLGSVAEADNGMECEALGDELGGIIEDNEGDMLSETIASVGHCVAKCKQEGAVEVEKD